MINKILTSLIIIIIILGFYKLTSKKPASVDYIQNNADLTLFFGNTCPHCKDVEEFISKNKINEKIKINQREVYLNKSNSAFFAKTVEEICPDKSSSEGLVVPFLIDTKDKKCFVGTPSITEYLSQKSK